MTRSEADHLSIEDALQLLREAFEINQLALEPVHWQFTAQLLNAFADGEPLPLLLLRRSLQILACTYGNRWAKFQKSVVFSFVARQETETELEESEEFRPK